MSRVANEQENLFRHAAVTGAYKAGLPLRVIAMQFGYKHTRSVRVIARANGAPPRKNGRPKGK